MASLLLWATGAISATVLGIFSLGDGAGSGAAALQKALQPSLSAGAEIYLPGSEGFARADERWSANAKPQFAAIVGVRTEEDVRKTVLYANERKQPFLAISGGHGQSAYLNGVKNGIGIWMGGMDGVEIVDGGKAAIMGGGVLNGDVILKLWEQGKQTSTTGCDCVGFIAPVLGGGHGWMSGRYGLPADQLLSARMVLGNGTAITVSDTEHPDLFWALRGAGQNFGIATEIKVKVYDREPALDQWSATSFIYTHDKAEEVFGLMNEWIAAPDRPKELIHYAVFAFNPEVDAEKPIIILWIYYQGPTTPPQYTTPLHALNPLASESKLTDLAGVNTHLMANKEGISCAKGYSRLFYPVSLLNYSLPGVRAVLDIFAELPPSLRGSVLMLEGYASNRIQEIPSDSTAFPDREREVLVSPIFTYGAGERGLDGLAEGFGKRIRAAFLEGAKRKLVAYVNYARGDEGLEAVYGYEGWRLERLRGLKKEYDPEGRFNFFEPIV